MSDTTYSNMETFEGNTSNISVLNFARKSRRVTVTNNSDTKNLQFKFNESERYATLYPNETFDLPFITNVIWLQGTDVDFRVWSLG